MPETHPESVASSLLNKILGKEKDVQKTVEGLKKEIVCDGETCKPVSVIPRLAYESYVATMRRNFENSETIVAKQKQFSSLCNKLFDNRNDYLLHSSTAVNDKESAFFVDETGSTENNQNQSNALFVLKLHLFGDDSHIVQNQKNAFFLVRRALQHPTVSSVALDVQVQDMTIPQMLRFYFNASSKAHVVGFLLVTSVEVPFSKIRVRTSGILQKQLGKLFSNVISDHNQAKIEFV